MQNEVYDFSGPELIEVMGKVFSKGNRVAAA
jgi:hypothetical protein